MELVDVEEEGALRLDTRDIDFENCVSGETCVRDCNVRNLSEQSLAFVVEPEEGEGGGALWFDFTNLDTGERVRLGEPQILPAYGRCTIRLSFRANYHPGERRARFLVRESTSTKGSGSSSSSSHAAKEEVTAGAGTEAETGAGTETGAAARNTWLVTVQATVVSEQHGDEIELLRDDGSTLTSDSVLSFGRCYTGSCTTEPLYLRNTCPYTIKITFSSDLTSEVDFQEYNPRPDSAGNREDDDNDREEDDGIELHSNNSNSNNDDHIPGMSQKHSGSSNNLSKYNTEGGRRKRTSYTGNTSYNGGTDLAAGPGGGPGAGGRSSAAAPTTPTRGLGRGGSRDSKAGRGGRTGDRSGKGGRGGRGRGSRGRGGRGGRGRSGRGKGSRGRGRGRGSNGSISSGGGGGGGGSGSGGGGSGGAGATNNLNNGPTSAATNSTVGGADHLGRPMSAPRRRGSNSHHRNYNHAHISNDNSNGNWGLGASGHMEQRHSVGDFSDSGGDGRSDRVSGSASTLAMQHSDEQRSISSVTNDDVGIIDDVRSSMSMVRRGSGVVSYNSSVAPFPDSGFGAYGGVARWGAAAAAWPLSREASGAISAALPLSVDDGTRDMSPWLFQQNPFDMQSEWMMQSGPVSGTQDAVSVLSREPESFYGATTLSTSSSTGSATRGGGSGRLLEDMTMSTEVELTLTPGEVKPIFVTFSPSVPADPTAPSAAKLQQRLFRVKLRCDMQYTESDISLPAALGELSASSRRIIFAKTCYCKALTCTSVVRAEPTELDLGNCIVGQYRAARIMLYNVSDFAAQLQPELDSKSLDFSRDIVHIQPHGQFAFKVEYVPRQVNTNYQKTFMFRNLNNALGNVLVGVHANNVDVHQVMLHSQFYSLHVDNEKRQTQVYFKQCFMNTMNVQFFELRNRHHGTLQMELLPDSSEIELYIDDRPRVATHAHTADQTAADDELAPLPPPLPASTPPPPSSSTASGAVPTTTSVSGTAAGSTAATTTTTAATATGTGSAAGSSNAGTSSAASIGDGAIASAAVAASAAAAAAAAAAASGQSASAVSGGGDDAAEASEDYVVRAYQRSMEDLSQAIASGAIASFREQENRIQLGRGERCRVLLVFRPDPNATITSQDPTGKQHPFVAIASQRKQRQTLLRHVRIRLLNVTTRDLSAKAVRELNETGDADNKVDGISDAQEAPIAPRLLLVRAKLWKTEMCVPQRNLHFGKIFVGEESTRSITIENSSAIPLMFSISKSGSINSGDLKVLSGRKGILQPYEARTVRFAFKPSMPGKFYENLHIVNVHNPKGEQVVTIKASVRRRPNFRIEDETDGRHSFGTCLVGTTSGPEVHFTVQNITSRTRQFILSGDQDVVSSGKNVCYARFKFEIVAASKLLSEDERNRLRERIEYLERKIRIAVRKKKRSKLAKLTKSLELVRAQLSGRVSLDVAEDDEEAAIAGVEHKAAASEQPQLSQQQLSQQHQQPREFDGVTTLSSGTDDANVFHFQLAKQHTCSVSVSATFLPGTGFRPWKGAMEFSGGLRIFESHNLDMVHDVPFQADVYVTQQSMPSTAVQKHEFVETDKQREERAMRYRAEARAVQEQEGRPSDAGEALMSTGEAAATSTRTKTAQGAEGSDGEQNNSADTAADKGTDSVASEHDAGDADGELGRKSESAVPELESFIIVLPQWCALPTREVFAGYRSLSTPHSMVLGASLCLSPDPSHTRMEGLLIIHSVATDAMLLTVGLEHFRLPETKVTVPEPGSFRFAMVDDVTLDPVRHHVHWMPKMDLVLHPGLQAQVRVRWETEDIERQEEFVSRAMLYLGVVAVRPATAELDSPFVSDPGHGSTRGTGELIPCMCALGTGSLRGPRQVDLGELRYGEVIEREVQVENASDHEMRYVVMVAHKATSLPMLQVDSSLATGIVDGGSMLNTKLVFAAERIGRWSFDVIVRDLRNRNDQCMFTVKAHVVPPNSLIVHFPDLDPDAQGEELRPLDLGALYAPPPASLVLGTSHTAGDAVGLETGAVIAAAGGGAAGRTGGDDAPKAPVVLPARQGSVYFFPLRVSNVSDEAVLVTASSSLHRQVDIFVDTTCTKKVHETLLPAQTTHTFAVRVLADISAPTALEDGEGAVTRGDGAAGPASVLSDAREIKGRLLCEVFHAASAEAGEEGHGAGVLRSTRGRTMSSDRIFQRVVRFHGLVGIALLDVHSKDREPCVYDCPPPLRPGFHAHDAGEHGLRVLQERIALRNSSSLLPLQFKFHRAHTVLPAPTSVSSPATAADAAGQSPDGAYELAVRRAQEGRIASANSASEVHVFVDAVTVKGVLEPGAEKEYAVYVVFPSSTVGLLRHAIVVENLSSKHMAVKTIDIMVGQPAVQCLPSTTTAPNGVDSALGPISPLTYPLSADPDVPAATLSAPSSSAEGIGTARHVEHVTTGSAVGEFTGSIWVKLMATPTGARGHGRDRNGTELGTAIRDHPALPDTVHAETRHVDLAPVTTEDRLAEPSLSSLRDGATVQLLVRNRTDEPVSVLPVSDIAVRVRWSSCSMSDLHQAATVASPTSASSASATRAAEEAAAASSSPAPTYADVMARWGCTPCGQAQTLLPGHATIATVKIVPGAALLGSGARDAVSERYTSQLVWRQGQGAGNESLPFVCAHLLRTSMVDAGSASLTSAQTTHVANGAELPFFGRLFFVAPESLYAPAPDAIPSAPAIASKALTPQQLPRAPRRGRRAVSLTTARNAGGASEPADGSGPDGAAKLEDGDDAALSCVLPHCLGVSVLRGSMILPQLSVPKTVSINRVFVCSTRPRKRVSVRVRNPCAVDLAVRVENLPPGARVVNVREESGHEMLETADSGREPTEMARAGPKLLVPRQSEMDVVLELSFPRSKSGGELSLHVDLVVVANSARYTVALTGQLVSQVLAIADLGGKALTQRGRGRDRERAAAAAVAAAAEEAAAAATLGATATASAEVSTWGRTTGRPPYLLTVDELFVPSLPGMARSAETSASVLSTVGAAGDAATSAGDAVLDHDGGVGVHRHSTTQAAWFLVENKYSQPLLIQLALISNILLRDSIKSTITVAAADGLLAHPMDVENIQEGASSYEFTLEPRQAVHICIRATSLPGASIPPEAFQELPNSSTRGWVSLGIVTLRGFVAPATAAAAVSAGELGGGGGMRFSPLDGVGFGMHDTDDIVSERVDITASLVTGEERATGDAASPTSPSSVAAGATGTVTTLTIPRLRLRKCTPFPDDIVGTGTADSGAADPVAGQTQQQQHKEEEEEEEEAFAAAVAAAAGGMDTRDVARFEIALGHQQSSQEGMEWQIEVENPSTTVAVDYAISPLSPAQSSWIELGRTKGQLRPQEVHSIPVYIDRSRMGTYSTYIMVQNLLRADDLKIIRVTMDVVWRAQRNMCDKFSVMLGGTNYWDHHAQDLGGARLVLDLGDVFVGKLYHRRAIALVNHSDTPLEFTLRSSFPTSHANFSLSSTSLKHFNALLVAPYSRVLVYMHFWPPRPELATELERKQGGDEEDGSVDTTVGDFANQHRSGRPETAAGAGGRKGSNEAVSGDRGWLIRGEVYIECTLIRDYQCTVEVVARGFRSNLRVNMEGTGDAESMATYGDSSGLVFRVRPPATTEGGGDGGGGGSVANDRVQVVRGDQHVTVGRGSGRTEALSALVVNDTRFFDIVDAELPDGPVVQASATRVLAVLSEPSSRLRFTLRIRHGELQRHFSVLENLRKTRYIEEHVTVYNRSCLAEKYRVTLRITVDDVANFFGAPGRSDYQFSKLEGRVAQFLQHFGMFWERVAGSSLVAGGSPASPDTPDTPAVHMCLFHFFDRSAGAHEDWAGLHAEYEQLVFELFYLTDELIFFGMKTEGQTERMVLHLAQLLFSVVFSHPSFASVIDDVSEADVEQFLQLYKTHTIFAAPGYSSGNTGDGTGAVPSAVATAVAVGGGGVAADAATSLVDELGAPLQHEEPQLRATGLEQAQDVAVLPVQLRVWVRRLGHFLSFFAPEHESLHALWLLYVRLLLKLPRTDPSFRASVQRRHGAGRPGPHIHGHAQR